MRGRSVSDGKLEDREQGQTHGVSLVPIVQREAVLGHILPDPLEGQLDDKLPRSWDVSNSPRQMTGIDGLPERLQRGRERVTRSDRVG